MQENKTKPKRWWCKLWAIVTRQQHTELNHKDDARVPPEMERSKPINVKEMYQRLGNNDISLVSLDLRNQNLQLEEATTLAKVLHMNTTLKMLNVGNNNLGDEGVLVIMQGLKNHTPIEYLILSANGVTNLDEFAPLLLQLRSLKWLDLSHNEIRHADALFEAVGKHNSLELLDLSLNQISDGEAICEALQQSHTLKDLNLFDNQLGDDCAIAIGNCVPMNLVKLNLGYNRIGNAGAKILAKTLAKSPSLKELFLTGNPAICHDVRGPTRNPAAA
jgi:Leucine-rich repeat (LRR) protein